jgi:hypothetical protein
MAAFSVVRSAGAARDQLAEQDMESMEHPTLVRPFVSRRASRTVLPTSRFRFLPVFRWSWAGNRVAFRTGPVLTRKVVTPGRVPRGDGVQRLRRGRHIQLAGIG